MSSIVALPPSGVGGATGTSQAKAALTGVASNAKTSVAGLIFILYFLFGQPNAGVVDINTASVSCFTEYSVTLEKSVIPMNAQ
jgi:hypothetical protein